MLAIQIGQNTKQKLPSKGRLEAPETARSSKEPSMISPKGKLGEKIRSPDADGKGGKVPFKNNENLKKIRE